LKNIPQENIADAASSIKKFFAFLEAAIAQFHNKKEKLLTQKLFAGNLIDNF
jgi:hypothetical protein